MKHDTKKLEPIPRSLVIIAWIMVLGLMAPMLDSTMINIAVHQLSNQFHTDLATVQWTVTGFILAMGAAAPFSSWLVAHFSGKKVYFWAEIGFGFASLLAGISWNIESLIIFRLIQGFTGGLIMPVMFTLLVDAVGGDKMGRIMAIIGVPMTLGPMLGPIIGGIIVEYATWRFIFFLNVPVIAIAAFLKPQRRSDGGIRMNPAGDRLQAPGYQVGVGALEVFSQLDHLGKGAIQDIGGGRRTWNQRRSRRMRRQRSHGSRD